MSKQRKAMLIFDIICTIIAAACVVVTVYSGNFGAAILCNMAFTLWLCNTAESLRFGEIEKITAKLKEEENKK